MEIVEIKYQNGNINEKFEATLNNKDEYIKDGRYEKWFENGIKECEGEYMDGKKFGYWKYWYENGDLKEEGEYLDDIKSGEWITYPEKEYDQPKVISESPDVKSELVQNETEEIPETENDKIKNHIEFNEKAAEKTDILPVIIGEKQIIESAELIKPEIEQTQTIQVTSDEEKFINVSEIHSGANGTGKEIQATEQIITKNITEEQILESKKEIKLENASEPLSKVETDKVNPINTFTTSSVANETENGTQVEEQFVSTDIAEKQVLDTKQITKPGIELEPNPHFIPEQNISDIASAEINLQSYGEMIGSEKDSEKQIIESKEIIKPEIEIKSLPQNAKQDKEDNDLNHTSSGTIEAETKEIFKEQIITKQELGEQITETKKIVEHDIKQKPLSNIIAEEEKSEIISDKKPDLNIKKDVQACEKQVALPKNIISQNDKTLDVEKKDDLFVKKPIEKENKKRKTILKFVYFIVGTVFTIILLLWIIGFFFLGGSDKNETNNKKDIKTTEEKKESTDFKQSNEENTTADIKLTIISWLNCIQEKDIPCIETFLADEYSFENRKNQNMIINKSERITAWKNLFSQNKLITVSFTNLDIKIESSVKAAATYRISYNVDPLKESGKKYVSLLRTNDKWLIYKEINQ